MLEFLWKFDWESVTIIVIASVIIYALDFVLFELYARRQDRRSEANEKRRLRKIRQLHGDLVGEIGDALTALKSSGTIKIDESTYEARSQGAFIEKDSRVRVIDVRNGILVVDGPLSVSDDFIEDAELVFNVCDGGVCPKCGAKGSLRKASVDSNDLTCDECGQLIRMDVQSSSGTHVNDDGHINTAQKDVE